jgi:uncharacterized membrane protein YgdD (TMEM256/DUF423 family)
MTKQLLITGSIVAALAVALGALGAHWLKENISSTNMQNFETAVRYQMYHAIAILVMATLPARFHIRPFRFAYYSFLTGIILFSGSVYLLSTRELSGIQWPWIGPVTPVGGLLFIAGWLFLVITAMKVEK